jgi:hypothetical protein
VADMTFHIGVALQLRHLSQLRVTVVEMLDN